MRRPSNRRRRRGTRLRGAGQLSLAEAQIPEGPGHFGIRFAPVLCTGYAARHVPVARVPDVFVRDSAKSGACSPLSGHGEREQRIGPRSSALAMSSCWRRKRSNTSCGGLPASGSDSEMNRNHSGRRYPGSAAERVAVVLPQGGTEHADGRRLTVAGMTVVTARCRFREVR
jgi:hypothetical protein